MLLHEIPMRDILHFLGWHGTPVEPSLEAKIGSIRSAVLDTVRPKCVFRRFAIEPDGTISGTSFKPQGESIRALLSGCSEVWLFAATLGAESERLLLREQARDPADALIMDAVLSAAIEAFCDLHEARLRQETEASGLFLTDRFSPGYGDMPLPQCRSICDVLNVQRSIGLTISESGIMMPRKSVTALMGISPVKTKRRPSGCAGCDAATRCIYRRRTEE